MIELTVNGRAMKVDADPAMPLLYALRDLAGLTGTKFGCGMGLCGACTVHVAGEPTRACLTPLSAVTGKPITTIEGVAQGENLHPLQAAWVDHKVAQCGYCQAGQIMAALALLSKNPTPSDTDIDNHMQGNICRCGTYPRIKAAIKTASARMAPVQIQEPRA